MNYKKWTKKYALIAGVFVLLIGIGIQEIFANESFGIVQNVYSNLTGNKNVKSIKKVKPEVAKSKVFKLTYDEIVDLYESGYGLQDIEKSEVVAYLANESVENVLKEKGKTEYSVTEDTVRTQKVAKGYVDLSKKYKFEQKGKNWDEVLVKLKVTDQTIANKTGITKKEVAEFTSQDVDKISLMMLSDLSYRYGKDVKEVVSDYTKNKSVGRLEKMYSGKKVGGINE